MPDHHGAELPGVQGSIDSLASEYAEPLYNV